MNWLLRYRFNQAFKNSICLLPLLGMVFAIASIRILHHIETAMDWNAPFEGASALTVLSTLAASMFTFIVFVSSALLISVQLASAQLTPRVIGLILQSQPTKLSLTLFVFSFTFTLGTLVHVDEQVPALTGYVSVYSCLASLGVFLYLVDVTCRVLRPSGAILLTARQGLKVIKAVYPKSFADSENLSSESNLFLDTESTHIVPNLREGTVLAFDMRGLVALAKRYDCVLEMVPQVGDFVSIDRPLFRIFGSGEAPSFSDLYHSVAVGPERTLEQDPMFALRILVDIASKALSPAVNDPTTAVLSIDRIQYLLRQLGTRFLDNGHARDDRGAVRLLYHTPGWDDFIKLGVTEIRQFGGSSIQVARRIRAMLQCLVETLPEQRIGALKRELTLLDRSIKRNFGEAEDLALAGLGDYQGVGGKLIQENENRPKSLKASMG